MRILNRFGATAPVAGKFDFDVIVLGGGAAGLTSAGIATNLGAKTLLVESNRLGGDCTWTGCIPSKTLLKAAKIVHQARIAGRYGLTDTEMPVDFGKLMAHVRSVRQAVYEDADAPEHFEAMGIEVRTGTASFLDPHTVTIENAGATSRVSGRFIVIATGSSALIPPIEGLRDTPFLTNESLFELDTQPARLAIIGAGPIGIEMAQAFSRLGSEVTVLDRGDRILAKDDPELAHRMQSLLEQERVHFVLGADIRRVAPGDGALRLEAETQGAERTLEADRLLVAAGRAANLDGLDLEAAGLNRSGNGIDIDDHCRTGQRHIFAVGDVTGRYQFTHMSAHMARVALTNALLKIPAKIASQQVPWVIYTEPEVAQIGALASQLDDARTRYRTYRFPYDRLDRAITEGETDGLIKVHARPLDGRILGASIMGAHAGELCSSITLAMRNGVTLRNIGDTIFPYPAWGEGVRRVADQWYVQKQSPWLTRLLKTVFGYRGPVIRPDSDKIV